jgi:putative endonuclease
MEKLFYVYFLTNRYNIVIYTGSTNDVYDRAFEHKKKFNKGFTHKYNCYKLVYYEVFDNRDDAAYRERQLKRYKRKWKENLINSMNPTWRDLTEDFEIDKNSSL